MENKPRCTLIMAWPLWGGDLIEDFCLASELASAFLNHTAATLSLHIHDER